MLTGEDGSRRFGYCRRLLVSRAVQSLGDWAPVCVCTFFNSSFMRFYILLPCMLLEATPDTYTRVCVHTHTQAGAQMRHSWGGSTQSDPSDQAPGSKINCNKRREWITFYWADLCF